MHIFKHSVQTTAPAWAVWQVLSDVSNWSKWDKDTEYSSINGPFSTGTIGEWKTQGSPMLQTKLTKVEPIKQFDIEIKLTLARVISSHVLTESKGKTTVTFETEIRGPLAFIWALLIGRSIKKKTPIEMPEMVKIAEKLSKEKMNA